MFHYFSNFSTIFIYFIFIFISTIGVTGYSLVLAGKKHLKHSVKSAGEVGVAKRDFDISNLCISDWFSILSAPCSITQYFLDGRGLLRHLQSFLKFEISTFLVMCTAFIFLTICGGFVQLDINPFTIRNSLMYFAAQISPSAAGGKFGVFALWLAGMTMTKVLNFIKSGGCH